MDENADVVLDGIKVEEKTDNKYQLSQGKSSGKELYPFEAFKVEDLAKQCGSYRYMGGEYGR